MAAAYENQRRAREQAGVVRRNKYETQADALMSRVLDLRELWLWAQPFWPLTAPDVPPLPAELEIKKAARSELRENSRYRWWRKSDRARLDELTRWRTDEIIAQRNAVQRCVSDVWNRYCALDPPVVLRVLDELLREAPVTAVPLAVASDRLTLCLAVPPAEALVWPEKLSVTKTGNISVKKRTNTEKHYCHVRAVLSTVVGAVRRCRIALPAIPLIEVLVVREDPSVPLSEADALGFVRVPVVECEALVPHGDFVSLAGDALRSWEASDGEPTHGGGAMAASFLSSNGEFLDRVQQHMVESILGAGRFKLLKSWAMRPIGTAGSVCAEVANGGDLGVPGFADQSRLEAFEGHPIGFWTNLASEPRA